VLSEKSHLITSSLTVGAGDTLEFQVGYGSNGTYNNDSTGLAVTVTAAAGDAGGADVRWVVTDQLGTPRMVLDKTGSLDGVTRHDYMPFGEDIHVGVGGRTTNQGYSVANGVRQKFTGQERDTETGLDYMKARYYASAQGRFTSPDPMPIKMRHLLDPQDLNRYSYVANNPLAYIDPEGLEKIRIILRTFIPQKTVRAPSDSIIGPATRVFRGDNRKAGQKGTYRTQQVITIETDPKKSGGNPLVSPPEGRSGLSHELKYGKEFTRQASGETLKASAEYQPDGGGVKVNAKGNEGNPFISSAPGITYDLTIGVQSEGANGKATFTLNGQHDGFPGYELLVVRPETGNDAEQLIYAHDPRDTGQTPLSLFGSGEFKVKNKTVTCDGKGKCKPE